MKAKLMFALRRLPMRQILLALTLLFCAASAHATACAYTGNGCVQYATGSNVASGSTSATLSGVSANHEIVISILSYAGTSFSFSSSLGLTYTIRQQVNTAPMSGDYCDGCYTTLLTVETGASSGNETFTATIAGGTTYLGPLEMFEYENVTSSPYDGSSFYQATGTGSATYSTGTITTTAAGDVLIVFGYSPGRASACPIGPVVGWSAASGFNLTASNPAVTSTDSCNSLYASDGAAGAAGTYQGQFTVATGEFIGTIMAVALKTTGGGSFATQISPFLVGP